MMVDKQKILEGLEHCISDEQPCVDCPYKKKCLREGWIVALQKDVLELLKQPEDKELHLDDLDMLVNMIATKAKAEGRFFSPYEVGLALVAHGQHDEQFKWGEVIKYSPSEVEQILNEVINDASKNS